MKHIPFLCLLLLASCAPRRVLTVENRLLLQENAELLSRIGAMEKVMPAPGAYTMQPDLEVIHDYLEREGPLLRRPGRGCEGEGEQERHGTAGGCRHQNSGCVVMARARSSKTWDGSTRTCIRG